MIDYSFLDRPEILMSLFHPRPEPRGPGRDKNARDLLIPVEEGVAIGARFHPAGRSAYNILFFHGNGEIVADYDELAPLYAGMNINFLPVDYRGYGRSSGAPTITGMMRDCQVIFDHVRNWLEENGYKGPLVVMGRSLGSASALELAANCSDLIDALIVESGFAYAGPLLRILGIDPDRFGFTEQKGFRNVDKIRSFDKPTLIIHAEFDHIIPFSDGEALYNASPARDKTLLKIPWANHNNIFALGLKEYMAAVKKLVESATSGRKGHS